MKDFIYDKVLPWWDYVSKGVWHDTRKTWAVDFVKILNLSVRSFFNRDMQSRACAMSFRTLLAIVPAFALIFAIGKGFGLHNFIQEQLYNMLPTERETIDQTIGYVKAYLDNSAKGMFVGVGIVFLLWTLISLVSNIERSFNLIWGVKGRGFGRKVTDYTAMLLILPIVMICAGGFNLAVSSTLQNLFNYTFLTPFIEFTAQLTSWILTWLFFTLVYYLLPNTKVKFKNALAAGIFAGTFFMLLQWIFVSGQAFVANYNAIYGSISFLPILLMWMQFTYVIVFAGAVVCYSSQNIFMYSFNDSIENISPAYFKQLILAVATVIVQRFTSNNGATTIEELISNYNLPPRLATMICDELVDSGIISVVEIDEKEEIRGFLPAINPNNITVEDVFRRIDNLGASNFVKNFEENFSGIEEITNDTNLTNININILTSNSKQS